MKKGKKTFCCWTCCERRDSASQSKEPIHRTRRKAFPAHSKQAFFILVRTNTNERITNLVGASRESRCQLVWSSSSGINRPNSSIYVNLGHGGRGAAASPELQECSAVSAWCCLHCETTNSPRQGAIAVIMAPCVCVCCKTNK